MLLVAFDEALVKCFPDIGRSIPVRVFGIKDLRCHRDDHSASPAVDAVGKRQPVEERRGLVVDAVFVGVFQHLDATGGGFRIRDSGFSNSRISLGFADP